MTLATQNLAQDLVGGFGIYFGAHAAVGDELRLGDGTEGIVRSLGWVSTSIRGYVMP